MCHCVVGTMSMSRWIIATEMDIFYAQMNVQTGTKKHFEMNFLDLIISYLQASVVR